MRLISRAELPNFIEPKPISPSISDVVMLAGNLENGPKFEEALPSWITDTMQGIHNKMKAIWNYPVEGFQVLDSAEPDGKSNVSRYIGVSSILDNDYMIGRVAIASQNLRVQVGGRGEGYRTEYLDWPVKIQTELPLGEFAPQTVETLKLIVDKLKSFEAIFPEGIGMQADIVRYLKDKNSQFEALQYGKDILSELGINADGIRVLPPF